MGLISWYDVTSIGYLSVQKTLERVARNVWFHEGGKKRKKEIDCYVVLTFCLIKTNRKNQNKSNKS